MTLGIALAILGAGVSVVLGGIGSIIGMATAGQKGAGVLSEKPELFGKILLVTVLPGTQGIYGFLGAFWIILTIGLLGAEPAQISMDTGWQLLFASFPVGLTCLFSGILQGRVSAAGLSTLAKDETLSGKAIILAALVETYAILGLLTSILLINGINI